MKERCDVIDLLRRMVKINTCQPEGNERQLTELLKELFSSYNADMFVEEISHSENRSTLIIRIGPDEPGGLAFVGHLDTVSVGDRTKWTYDPHAAVLVDGKVYGRGTADMKAGVAAMTAAALDCLREGVEFKIPLYLVYTADEEKGSRGVKAVVESDLLVDVAAFIIPEPTDNKIAIAEKGAFWLRFHLEGKSAHGSKPEIGINAVEAAVELSKTLKKSFVGIAQHKLLGDFTLSITKIEGGIMTNVIPAEAVIEVDMRTLPEQNHKILMESIDSCIEYVQEVYPGLKVQTEVINNFVAVSTDGDSDFIEIIREYAREEGLPGTVCGMTYYTDAASLIPVYQKPFAIMGPGHESMAHQLDEAVDVDSVYKAMAVYNKLIKDLSI